MEATIAMPGSLNLCLYIFIFLSFFLSFFLLFIHPSCITVRHLVTTLTMSPSKVAPTIDKWINEDYSHSKKKTRKLLKEIESTLLFKSSNFAKLNQVEAKLLQVSENLELCKKCALGMRNKYNRLYVMEFYLKMYERQVFEIFESLRLYSKPSSFLKYIVNKKKLTSDDEYDEKTLISRKNQINEFISVEFNRLRIKFIELQDEIIDFDEEYYTNKQLDSLFKLTSSKLHGIYIAENYYSINSFSDLGKTYKKLEMFEKVLLKFEMDIFTIGCKLKATKQKINQSIVVEFC